MIIIVTGEQGIGKTCFLQDLLTSLRKQDIPAAGILAPCEYRDGRRQAYELINIHTQKRVPFIATEEVAGWNRFRNLWFNPDGFSLGRKALDDAWNQSAPVVIIDEIGPMELEDRGWADSLRSLLKRDFPALIISVRNSIIQKVQKHFDIHDATIWYAKAASPDAAGEYLASVLHENHQGT